MSRALSTAADLVDFLDTLPNQRIVCLHGYISSGGDELAELQKIPESLELRKLSRRAERRMQQNPT